MMVSITILQIKAMKINQLLALKANLETRMRNIASLTTRNVQEVYELRTMWKQTYFRLKVLGVRTHSDKLLHQ